MNWKKLGNILKPSPDIWWMHGYTGASFVRTVGNELWMYVTGRDKQGESRIGIVRGIIEDDVWTTLSIDENPVLDLGEMGCFDESGVSYPWITEHNGDLYMYYVGWVAGSKNRFMVFIGLAKSTDNGLSFHRVSKAPVLDRTPSEPLGTGSCSVYIKDGVWKMYYTAYEPWITGGEQSIPVYNVKYAESLDGVHWQRNGKAVLDFKNSGEHIIAKPHPIFEDNMYKLWYCYRGHTYRIGYAESENGVDFVRKDADAGIDVSVEGWDSEMIEYPNLFDYQGKRYMIYCGNTYGKTGLGLAVLNQ